ncbi:hypothetical protein [Streptomyces sp. NTH33]|uniref:hypothetical protein n=1 Tax=Streptomyces sp. NTH33 TaxID=1735453 RepID=UPI0011B94079|nr:hypothetical protein [Streptomyces sp. NTH33]
MADYRAYITDATGSVEEVPPEKLTGVEGFLDSWQQSPETPQEFNAKGWQGCDDRHPAGSGKPAYRVVYKTLRLVPYPALEMVWPNLRVRFCNGDVQRGGMRVPTAMKGRTARHHIIPEFGRVFEGPNGSTYLPCPDLNLAVSGWEDDLKAVSFVEIIYVIDDAGTDDYEDLMVKGRQGLASLKTLLDLRIGPRLLAIPITEEVGETFEDWHWNRRIDTGLFSAESQAVLRHLEAKALAADVSPLIERNQALDSDERRRITLACQWYWRADAETDQTVRFIAWWLVVESLEMVRTTDIRPVRTRLADLLAIPEDVWRGPVGKLFGLRSKVVHGEIWEVPEGQNRLVESLARTLLCGRLLGEVPDDVRQALLAAAQISIR